jgi:hypothetical protein
MKSALRQIAPATIALPEPVGPIWALMIAAFALPALSVANAETTAVVSCKVIVDHAADRIRAGDIESARRYEPQIKQCREILRAETDREARRVVREHDARIQH